MFLSARFSVAQPQTLSPKLAQGSKQKLSPLNTNPSHCPPSPPTTASPHPPPAPHRLPALCTRLVQAPRGITATSPCDGFLRGAPCLRPIHVAAGGALPSDTRSHPPWPGRTCHHRRLCSSPGSPLPWTRTQRRSRRAILCLASDRWTDFRATPVRASLRGRSLGLPARARPGIQPATPANGDDAPTNDLPPLQAQRGRREPPNGCPSWLQPVAPTATSWALTPADAGLSAGSFRCGRRPGGAGRASLWPRGQVAGWPVAVSALRPGSSPPSPAESGAGCGVAGALPRPGEPLRRALVSSPPGAL